MREQKGLEGGGEKENEISGKWNVVLDKWMNIALEFCSGY